MNNDAPHFFESRLLPPEARAILQRAAATRVPDDDLMARTRAVDEATRRVKRQYPAFFQVEIDTYPIY